MKNTSIIHKGGMYLIQENSQKGSEKAHLDFFMNTGTGKEWCSQNQLTKITPHERPDFLFETATGKCIGLEITNFIIKTDKFHATSALQNIADQICRYFKEKHGIAISILIDIYDERKWSARWSEHLDYLYDPGFRHLEASNKSIKDEIIKALTKEGIKSWGITKVWVDVDSQKFVVTADRMFEPHTSAHVNNGGMCIEDPFEELQNTINAKNNQVETYRANCDECDLLVVLDSEKGNYTLFTGKINSCEFISSFREVYLLDFASKFDVTAIKLKTTK